MRKVVIVTGGTSGIGFAAARKFLEEHAVVVVASLDPQDIVGSPGDNDYFSHNVYPHSVIACQRDRTGN